MRKLTLLFWLLVSLSTVHAAGPSLSQFSVDLKATAFHEQLKAFVEDWPKLQAKAGRLVKIRIDPRLEEEEYQLSLGKAATIRAGSPVAVAWGLQTLGEIAGSQRAEIHDHPAYHFRCVTVDVARRFHSLSTLRQIIRWCHAGKVRFIQLHLTDDQNWMLPTTILAGVDRNNSSGHPAYTREEMQRLQSFAAARGISIIPEVDIPGHSTLLVKFNPTEFSIKGSPSSNCINFGSPEVRKTMRSLIQEIAGTFPQSPYLHIGGDEASYPDAGKDADMAKAMKGGSVQDVFVDFVAEMAETVIALKKTPIVWEGFGPSTYARKKIPRETVVVAWEGTYYPPQDLLRDGFRVVNAGWDPYYVVNHYPYDAFTLVPLPNLLRHDPKNFGIVNWSPGSPASAQLPLRGELLGSMLCWWEGREWNAQDTLPLRIFAMGNRLWNRSPSQELNRFLERSHATLKRIHDATIPFQVTVDGGPAGKWIRPPGFPTSAAPPKPTIPYPGTIDGSCPEKELKFSGPATVQPQGAPGLTFGIRTDGEVPRPEDVKEKIEIWGSSVVSIQAYRGRVPVGETEFLNLKRVFVEDNLALGAKVTSSSPEDPQFPARVVTDGDSRNVGSFWLGYALPCSLTVDLGQAVQITRIDVVPFWAAGQPTQYMIDSSVDGKTWTPVADASDQEYLPTARGYIHRFYGEVMRYIRVTFTGSKQFPPSMVRIHEIRAFSEI